MTPGAAPHAVVVGATGMLADLTLWLAGEGYLTSAARLLHVRGSARADPIGPRRELQVGMARFPDLSYETVVLGYREDGGRSRWLTDEEIVSGVIGAILEPGPRTVVGTVEPWSKRP